jgi:hypothetical protein
MLTKIASTVANPEAILPSFNALVLHPLAVPEGNRIYQVQTKRSEAISISFANYADIRDRNSTLSSLAIFRLARIGIGVHGMAQPVWGYEVSGNYFLC